MLRSVCSGVLALLCVSSVLAVAQAPKARSTANTFAQIFGVPDPSLTANNLQPQGVVGDFNEDGLPDLLLSDINVPAHMTQVQVFGSGKLVALPLQDLSIPGNLPTTIPAVLDVNGDGHLDLLFGNMVAYGKGDGTFGTPVILPILTTGFSQTYAVDVTGDSKADIVAVNTPSNPSNGTGSIQFTLTVFRNDGSGAFTSLGSFPLAAPLPQISYVLLNVFGLSFADLNGDGKLDIVSQSNGVFSGNASSTVNVYSLLNNGDGTFAAPVAVDTSATLSLGYDSSAFADLNADGKTDLVLSYPQFGERYFVGAALGNGDGTFGPVQQLSLNSQLISTNGSPSLQLGDYNLDGKIDAVIGTGQLALGNGDGTFTPSSPLFAPANSTTPALYPLLQATFLPDSLPSFVFLNLTSGANAVFTPLGSSSATKSLTVTSSQNPSYVGGSPMITATVAGLQPNAGGTVTFTTGSTTLTTVPLKNGSASFDWSYPASVSTVMITATYSGDANNATASGSLNETFVLPISIPAPAAGTTTLTVASGSAAQGSVTVSGAAGYAGPLGLSCTGLPANASCSFIPQLPSIGNGPTSFTFYLATSSSAQPLGSVREPGGGMGLQIVWCGLPLLGAILAGSLRRPRASLFCLIACFSVLLGLSGCGGNSSKTGTPSSGMITMPGTYTFQVNANSGGATASETYTLIVQ